MALARKNNPDSALAQSRAAAENASIGPAGALPDPTVSFALLKAPQKHVAIAGANGIEYPNLFGALPGMTEYSVSMGQGIPWPKKLAAREDIARQVARHGEIAVHETALALEADVLASCLELLAVQARLELLISQLRYWSKAEEIIKARLDQGGSSASDAIAAMQEQSRLKLRLIDLEAQAQDQKDLLNQLTVRGQDAPIELDASIFALELPRPMEENELLNDLKGRNPEWLASQVDIQSADASIRFAKLDRFPDFHVGAGIARAGSMPVALRVEAGVGLPLWSGRKQNKVLAKAQAERLAAESVRTGLALALATKSRERSRAWRLAAETARLYETELIPQGEAALEIIIARFQNGGATFGSMLDAMNALLKDQENHLEAVAQCHRIAILHYRASLGDVSSLGNRLLKSNLPKG
jgi:outer membrane protein TolC